MNKKEWLNQDNKECRDMIEKRFKDYQNKYKNLHNNTNKYIKNQMIVNVKNRMFNKRVILKTITFNEQINYIEQL